MEHENEKTVEIRDVTVMRQTDLALLCRIENLHLWIAPTRLQPGSTVARKGDVGTLVLTHRFAVERGLASCGASANAPRRPTSCEGLRKDGLPCCTPRRHDSRFCFRHDPATANEREASEARLANSSARRRGNLTQ
jgi:hypothetical protein